ncbi:MAG: type II toxin-antitoxin system HicB family antitoxin [Pirellulales bacterium]|nr:type II toxin-antitoxin system HicB family antitoxin [Pirellulales bacterium]
MSTADDRANQPVQPAVSGVPPTYVGDQSYRCNVRLCPEEDGGYAAYALNLPGAVSQGDSEAEALANIREACSGVIKAYLERDGKIPWGAVDAENCAGSREFWIVVSG